MSERSPPKDAEATNGSPSAHSTTNSNLKDATSDKQQRKRLRVPTSCSVCRKRKIRCDKQKPVCGSCTKSHVAHLCHFEDPSWLNSEEVLKYANTIPPKRSKHPTEEAPILQPIINFPQTSATQPPVLPINNTAMVGASIQTYRNLAQPRAPPNVVNGVDINSLPPDAKKLFEELTFRVKHLEASIAVHDLSKSYRSSPSNIDASTSTLNNDDVLKQEQKISINQTFSKTGPLYDFNPDARIEFFKYLPFMIKKTRLESHGPFSSVSLMKKDVYLKILWMHIWKTMDQTTAESDKNPCITAFASRGSKSLASFLEVRRKKLEHKAAIEQFEKSDAKLDQLILEALPTKKTIMTLAFRFFKHVFPFFPFINENIFFTEIDSIIGPLGFNNDPVTQLKITSKYDYCSLGLLLLVLRLAFFSISDEEFDENPDFKPLKDDANGSKMFYAINKCLFHYKFLRKSYGLKMIQFVLYYKIYFKYCPEDDDTSDLSETQNLLGVIFSIAYSIGFNRDPSKLSALTSSVKKKQQTQIWRRIWHKLLELDCQQSLLLGTKLHCSDDSSYDTALPLDDPDHDDIDSFITDDFKFVSRKNDIYREISNKCLNIRRAPTLLEILHLIKRLESFITTISSMKDILNEPSYKPYMKAKKIGYLIEAYGSLLSLKLIVLIHFIENNNQEKLFQYVEECLNLALKVSNSTMNIAYNEKLYFGSGFFYYLRPLANSAICRAALILLSIAVAVLHAKQLAAETDLRRYNLLSKLGGLILKNLDNILQLLEKLSARQYNFTRITMAFRLLHYHLKDPDYSFISIANETRSMLQERSPRKLMNFHLHDMNLEDIPQYNYAMNLLESEIIHLSSISQTDLVGILQPTIGALRTSKSGGKVSKPQRSTDASPNQVSPLPAGSNPISSSGTYYNPVSGNYQSKVSSSTASVGNSDLSPFDKQSPLKSYPINFDNIFDHSSNRLDKLLNPEFDSLNGFDPALLTSEDFYSVFGVFEGYTAGADAANTEL